MKAVDFEYDGRNLSDIGFEIVQFDGGGGFEYSTAGSELSLTTISTHGGKRHSLVNAVYEEVFVGTISICKPDGATVSSEEYSFIMRWLNRKTFAPLKILTSDLEDIHFIGTFSSIEKVEHLGRIIGFNLTFTTNAPFGWGDQVTDNFYINSNHPHIVNDYIGDVRSVSGSIASFPDGADNVPVKSLTVAIEPVQSGTGDPSPDNVRPIMGWTAAKVYRTGKNLLPNTSTSGSGSGVTRTVNADGTIELSGTSSGLYLVAVGTVTLPSGTYSVNGCPTNSNSLTFQIRENNVNGTTICTDSGSGATLTLSETTTVCACTRVPNGQIISGTLTVKPMIRLSSVSDATYEPYKGTTYNVSLSNAGTVYGGTLDVTTGVLTVDRRYNSVTAFSSKSSNATNDQFLIGGNTAAKTNAQVICNMAPQGAIFSNALTAPVCGFANDTRGTFRFAFPKSMGIDTLEKANALIPASGLHYVYELATPQTYQLTPTEVTTLLGTNNIWADTGDVTVEYAMDGGYHALYAESGDLPFDEMIITCNEAGILELTNAANGVTTLIVGCQAGEVITIKGWLLSVTSSTGRNVYDSFNFAYPQLVGGLLSSSEVVNSFTSSLSCNITAKYTPIRKVVF